MGEKHFMSTLLRLIIRYIHDHDIVPELYLCAFGTYFQICFSIKIALKKQWLLFRSGAAEH